MDKQEYGGCLWFDSGLYNQDYYEEFKNKRVEVDCGRSAIQYVIEKYSYKRLYLPVYNCPLVSERIIRVSDIEVMFYNLHEDFTPDIMLENLKKGDVLLWVNYCGVMSERVIDEVSSISIKTDADVIIDNIPAFFSRPRLNAFNIYSCRKFIGVPDGGYLIGDKVEPEQLPQYETAENYLYLLKAIEQGSNTAYLDYQKSEGRITSEGRAYGMPELTKRILGSVDYARIKKIRMKNFQKMHELLGDRNRMNMNFHSETPSIYPYLTKNINLRQRLLERKVYISRFWKHVLTSEKSNAFERDLAEFLIPLPIDQRYTEKEMSEISQIVIEEERV